MDVSGWIANSLITRMKIPRYLAARLSGFLLIGTGLSANPTTWHHPISGETWMSRGYFIYSAFYKKKAEDDLSIVHGQEINLF